MKNIVKKTLATVIAITSLSLCTYGNVANAASEPDTGSASSISVGASTKGYYSGTLYDTAQHFVERVKGPTTVSVYANFSSTVEIDYYFNGVYINNFTYSSGSPSQSVTVPANTECKFYVKAYYASSSNPVSGYVNIY